ncbi:MAG: GspE/PulE family protein, partial [Acidimicrobiales bacterium]
GDAAGIAGMGSLPGMAADGLGLAGRDPDSGLAAVSPAAVPPAAIPPIPDPDPAGPGGFGSALADPGVVEPGASEPVVDSPGAAEAVALDPEVAELGLARAAAELVDPAAGTEPPSPALPVPETSSPIGDLDALAAITSPAPPGTGEDGVDSVVLTADLVDEAVATFEGQHPEGSLEAANPAAGALSAMPALARALVEGDRVSIEEMEAVLDEHHRSGQSIARILTARRLVTEADLMWGMAQEMGLEFVDLDVVGVNMATAGLLPAATARHHNVLVIGYEQGVPVVAASNPTDVFAMDDLRTIMGRSFITVVATRSQLETYISRSYQGGGDAADMAVVASADFDESGPGTAVQDIEAATDDAPIVRYVNLLILQALNERASDIHVEPTASDLRIRYRIDGVLHDVSTAPRSIASAVTTRLKVMADMNIAEHRIPQDGRISLNVGTKGIDLRMATLPTIHGEKIVMRVLDKSSVVLGFSDLGFDDDLLAAYEEIYTKPYGTILVTGPTGSGKSTTLYTTLTALNAPEKNIITVEDPVELQIQGINQVQLNVKAGLTFASALKSILRSDPDIVLVGEIRDKETAIIAIEASLTGHLVLATLHTNSAASTPMRLVEMGLEPFMVTSSLSAVVAQRLARRLCVHCKEAYDPEEIEFVAAGWSMEEVERAGGATKLYRAIGCSACSNTGYKGRKALVELMPMTEEIERLIIEGGSVDEIHRLAVAQGMVTLRQSGLRKAMEGETTLEEVLRVVA